MHIGMKREKSNEFGFIGDYGNFVFYDGKVMREVAPIRESSNKSVEKAIAEIAKAVKTVKWFAKKGALDFKAFPKNKKKEIAESIIFAAITLSIAHSCLHIYSSSSKESLRERERGIVEAGGYEYAYELDPNYEWQSYKDQEEFLKNFNLEKYLELIRFRHMVELDNIEPDIQYMKLRKEKYPEEWDDYSKGIPKSGIFYRELVRRGILHER